MKYIEILRAQGHYIMEGAPGEIAHYALKVLCQGDGNERRTPEEAAQVARSVALATNEHDKLTGLHDELVQQRDALVAEVGKAKTRFSHLHGALSYVYRVLQEKSGSEYGLDSFEVQRCLHKLDAALALMRGEGDG